MRKPRGFWTKERVLEEAKKYRTFTDWEKNSASSCAIAQKRGWIKEATVHMIKKEICTEAKRLALQNLGKCRICTKVKDLNLFNKSSKTVTGYRKECKDCHLIETNKWRNDNRASVNLNNRKRAKRNPDKFREYSLKSNYNLTLEKYNLMRKNQDYRCGICKTEESKLIRKLNVDHCHSSGKVRELLCDKCNRGLGHFNDNIDLLNEAITYIKKYK